MSEQRQLPRNPRRDAGAARAVIVGAGVGGLAAAIDLARRGVEVLVVERAGTPGGKLREVMIGDRPLDAGPTVFTMRWVFEELFADAGVDLDAHLPTRSVETLARHAWSESERLDLFADIDRSVDAIAAFAGPGEGRRYRAFCARAADVYGTLERPFLRAARPTPLSLTARAGWRGLPGLLRIAPFSTLWSALGESFRDPRLQQLFGRYATYCGSSPFAAPATLMLVAHVEQQGVWLVDGGMHGIARALARLATQLGATIRLGCDVREVVVEGGRATGVRIDADDGGSELIGADAVIFNGDVAALAGGLLGSGARSAVRATPQARRSLSALTWNVVGHGDGFPLLRHNVFFGADYRDEFDAIFKRGQVPRDPTVYVCAQDRDDAGARPNADPERLLCLVNAPANGDAATFDPQEVSRCQERMSNVLARNGLQIRSDPARTVTTTPVDFARLYPGSGGALYGQASHGWAASFSRPGARSAIPGLYLAGGSVHPGPGVPMAALSGRQAATSLLADRARDRASTARFPIPATHGGTSMR
ncbi:MAG: phytoene desaturase [Burkholderiales bacterium]|nr:phytoene desaturase [Burkholderiales bacterium]